jgi:glutamate-1-semialdehyde 2,1-aminomutase
VACGLATLREIQRPGFYEELGTRTRQLVSGLTAAAHAAAPGVPFAGDSVGGMFGVYFAAEPPVTYGQVMAADKERFNRFFHAMLQRGVYLAPSAFEAGFVSIAHDAAVIDETITAARAAFGEIAQKR